MLGERAWSPTPPPDRVSLLHPALQASNPTHTPLLACPLQDKMKLIILDHYSQASEWAAKYIRNRIIQFNPGPDKYFTLGLPTGACWAGVARWRAGTPGIIR